MMTSSDETPETEAPTQAGTQKAGTEHDDLVMAPKKPTEAMLEAGFGPFLAAHDLMFCKNEPCGPIYKAVLPKTTDLS